MTYDPAWRAQDERRIERLEKLYHLDGRQHKCHPLHGTYTELVTKYGVMKEAA